MSGLPNPTQQKCVVPLDIARRLHFDGNAMAAFEAKTGRHFLEIMADIQDAQADALRDHPDDEARQQTATVRAISLTVLCDIVWAGCLEYNGSKGPPSWPLTQEQVRRYITIGWMNKHTGKIFKAFQEDTPDKEDLPVRMREDGAAVRPMTDAEASTRADGGRPGGASGVSILDALTLKSED